MVLASVADEPDPAVEALRRLGVMRVATKYPRIAADFFERTGRQAEIVEVKGSVELAPLTGLVEAIVDLTATGTTLRENRLVVREEIAVATARLIANPVAHKLKAAAIDEVLERLRAALSASRPASTPRRAADRVRALAPGAESVAGAVARDRRRRARATATSRCARYVERFDGADGALRVAGDELARGARRPRPGRAGRARDGDRERPRGGRGRPRRRRRGRAPAGPDASRCATSRSRRAAIYVPGGRAPYPSTVVMGVVTARAAGVEEVVVCAPGAHPVILAACALCGVDEVFAMGGAHAVAALAYGTETVAAGRRDRRARATSTSRRPSASSAATSGSTASPAPRDVVVLASAGADPALVSIDLAAQAEHGTGTVVLRRVATSPRCSTRSTIDARATRSRALVDAPDLETALAFAEAFAPEHLELVGAAAEALAPRVRTRRLRCSSGARAATAFGDYVAGSNHTPADRRRRALRLGARRRAHFRRRMSEVRIGRGRRRAGARRRRRSRGPRASSATQRRWRCGRMAAR